MSDQFGSMLNQPGAPAGAAPATSTSGGNVTSRAPPPGVPAVTEHVTQYPLPESVYGDDVQSGASNVGLVRPTRRGVKGKTGPAAVLNVPRNYRVATTVQFNNLEEVYQDTVSADHAQDILEEVFRLWKVPFDQPEALKYSEDLVFAFIVAVTASNKADYNKVYEIPVKPVRLDDGSTRSIIDADMGVLSTYLARSAGVTRRQFARGLADRVRVYLRDPDNVHLLDDVATKVGCDRQMADLGFDGSTHCKGMNAKEVQFTKMLENRNLFEREDQMAGGASERLMNIVTNSARAVR